MDIEELKVVRETALAHMWATWAAIGGKAADEAVKAAQAAPQLSSEYVTEGTYGLPRWQKERLHRERSGAQARAQARLNAALEARDELRLNPAFAAAQAAADEAAEAIQKVVWAKRPAKTAKEMAEEIALFRWNGKDNDGDWNE